MDRVGDPRIRPALSVRYVDSWDRWHDDPAADDVVPNDAGGTDCVIDLTEAAQP